MLKAIEQENIHKLFKQRNAALVLAFGMLLTNILLGITIFQKDEKVIVVPAYLKQSFWVEGEVVSKTYFEDMTTFFASMLLNVSEDSMDYQWTSAMKYVAPEFHNTMKSRLIEEMSRLKRESLSTTFRPKSIEVNADHGAAKIEGIMTRYIAGKRVGDSNECYLATYDYRGGILLLAGFEECEDEKN